MTGEKRPPAATDPAVLEIYKLHVEMADRVSRRRQTANSFYLSVCTLLVGGSAYLKSLGIEGLSAGLIPIAGIAVSALWIRAIDAYTVLNDAKFAVINELENLLPVQPYGDEWARLQEAAKSEAKQARQRGKKYRPFHKVEVWIPWLFILLFAAQGTMAFMATERGRYVCEALIGDLCTIVAPVPGERL